MEMVLEDKRQEKKEEKLEGPQSWSEELKKPVDFDDKSWKDLKNKRF